MRRDCGEENEPEAPSQTPHRACAYEHSGGAVVSR